MVNIPALNPYEADLERIVAVIRAIRREVDDGMISFFDYVPVQYIPGILDGTNTVDLGQYWQAFRDALAAQTHPQGFIPAGRILTSVSPNFAISGLQLRTGGNVVIEYTGVGLAGFMLDGSTGVGQVLGTFCTDILIDRIDVQADNSDTCVFVYSILMSSISARAVGCIAQGLYVSTCNTVVFDRFRCNYPLTTVPTYGMYLDGLTAACIFYNVNIDTVEVGIRLESAVLNTFVGGTSESCTSIGIDLQVDAKYNTFVNLDLENSDVGVDYDILCSGSQNAFYGTQVHSTNTGGVTLGGTAFANIFHGGFFTDINIGASCTYNSFESILIDGTLVDSGTFNRHDHVMVLDSGISIPLIETTISVGASPFVHANTTGNMQQIIISGGTVSSIAFERGAYAGLSVGFASGVLMLAPADAVTVVYTVAPTMTAVEMPC